MRSTAPWEITVESDWLTTLGAGVLFILSALLLVREINHFIGGHISGPVRIHLGFLSIWNKMFEVVAATYCFIVAFKLPNKYVKTACLLLGINIAGSVLLSCFQIPPRALHIAVASGSVVRQVALTIFCVALAQWLKSVVRWGRQSELPGGES